MTLCFSYELQKDVTLHGLCAMVTT